MPSTVTLAQLIERSRQRADMVSNTFLDATGGGPEDEIYVQQSAKAIHSLLVAADPDFYTISVALASTDPTFADWNLPTDNYKIRKVVYRYGGWDRVVRRLDLEAFVHFSNIGGVTFPSGYYLQGQVIRFAPRLSGATPAPVLYYIRGQPLLTGGASPVLFDARDGWDEWIVLDVAIKMLSKEESDTRSLVAERDRVLMRIIDQSADRDVGEPPQIIDTDLYQLGIFPNLPQP